MTKYAKLAVYAIKFIEKNQKVVKKRDVYIFSNIMVK